MDYYDKLIERILKIKDKNPSGALALIDEELNLPYIPRDIHTKLNEIKDSIYIPKDNANLSYEKIVEYLYASNQKQLIATYKLGEMNLRDHLDLIQDYFKSDGYFEAKVGLIMSLIEQEINHEFVFVKDKIELIFNPIHTPFPDYLPSYKNINKMLTDYYMKDPDKLILADDELYAKFLYFLPVYPLNIDEVKIFNDITSYIDSLFI